MQHDGHLRELDLTCQLVIDLLLFLTHKYNPILWIDTSRIGDILQSSGVYLLCRPCMLDELVFEALHPG